MQEKKTVMPRKSREVSGATPKHRHGKLAHARRRHQTRHRRPHAAKAVHRSRGSHSAIPLNVQSTKQAGMDGGAMLLLPLGLAIAAAPWRRCPALAGIFPRR